MTRQFNIPGEQATAQQASFTQKPVVDQAVCTGCQKCISICPEGAIEMQNKKAFILAEKCTNCRRCVPICPVSAIN
ncbi:4Fe-4S binding protein [candidate division KSB1 bacterium]|nr:4Fe-4S binding protein [candidate division KSB1 bacterium]